MFKVAVLPKLLIHFHSKVDLMRQIFLPPIVLLVCVILMIGLHIYWPVIHFMVHPIRWVGMLLVVAGILMASWHARLFRRIKTQINTFHEPGQLTTEGLFARTRNPMYLGMLMCLIGVSITLGSLSPIIGLVIFGLLLQCWYIPFEEAAMARKFGDQYLDYQRKVPRWL
jgi:protein-S-isoprenylcysteine O-methyltransferase Ste14